MEGMKNTHQFGLMVCVMLCSLAPLVVQGMYTRSLGYRMCNLDYFITLFSSRTHLLHELCSCRSIWTKREGNKLRYKLFFAWYIETMFADWAWKYWSSSSGVGFSIFIIKRKRVILNIIASEVLHHKLSYMQTISDDRQIYHLIKLPLSTTEYSHRPRPRSNEKSGSTVKMDIAYF